MIDWITYSITNPTVAHSLPLYILPYSHPIWSQSLSLLYVASSFPFRATHLMARISRLSLNFLWWLFPAHSFISFIIRKLIYSTNNARYLSHLYRWAHLSTCLVLTEYKRGMGYRSSITIIFSTVSMTSFMFIVMIADSITKMRTGLPIPDTKEEYVD